jgi:hypothetical protein
MLHSFTTTPAQEGDRPSCLQAPDYPMELLISTPMWRSIRDLPGAFDATCAAAPTGSGPRPG